MDHRVKRCSIVLQNVGMKTEECVPALKMTRRQKKLSLESSESVPDTKMTRRQKKLSMESAEIVPTLKMTKEQKRLLLPTKKPKKVVKTVEKAANSTKRGRKPAAKFQMKVSSRKSGSSSQKAEEDRASPDSGVESRSNSPLETNESNPHDDSLNENEDVDEGVEADVEKEKAKFLDDLDCSDEQIDTSSNEEESDDDWNGDEEVSRTNAVVKKNPPKLKKGKNALLAPIVIPGAMKSELALSDYEKIRDNNIKARDDMLAKLMADFNQYKQDNGLAKPPPGKKLQKKKTKADAAFQSAARAPITLRKSSRLVNQDKKETLGTIEWDNPEADKRKRLAEEDSDYEDEDQPQRKRRCHPNRWAVDPNAEVLMPDQVTPKMLANISYSSTGKVYNTSTGTTCHQCRQKTTDQKTVCRSGQCSGVRGMFCGRCLQNRYGEEATEALMNPTWSCPPCRGFCNCSICRNRDGKGATGILIHLAQSKGFDNVKDYLLSLQKSKGSDEFDE